MSRRHAALAAALLALGLAGVLLTGVATGSNSATTVEIKVSVGDGKVTLSRTTFTAGKVTFVVVNKGTKKHALAVMGTTMAPKRTPALAVGKTARLTVTLTAGRYHVWDPVTSSMSHAKFLLAKAPAAGKTTTGKSTAGTGTSSTSGGSSGGSGSSGGGSSGGGSTGGGGGTGTMDPGMEGCDHM
jgi:uncharacterized membrane protein YgcG